MGFVVMGFFDKWSLSFVEMTIAPYTKNVLESLLNALPTKIGQKKLVLHLDVLATKCTKKTGAFLRRNLPVLLRLAVHSEPQPVPTLLNQIPVVY